MAVCAFSLAMEVKHREALMCALTFLVGNNQEVVSSSSTVQARCRFNIALPTQ